MADASQAARDRMVQQQLVARGIASQPVLAAMAKVPRERFVPHISVADAYADRAWAVACEQSISQPYIVALMTEALELSGSDRVLEIGTGTGYQTAILAELAHSVVSVERHAELSAQAAKRIDELGYANIQLKVGDGSLGWPDHAPYDGVLVTAAAQECPPALSDQLAEGGRLVMPVGHAESQVLQLYRKVAGQIDQTPLSGCRFVPLIGQQGWPEK